MHKLQSSMYNIYMYKLNVITMSKCYLILVDTVQWFLLVNHLVHLRYTNKHTHTQLLTTLVHGFSPLYTCIQK